MEIYNENGYANMQGILHLPVPFIFVIGGRGTGKTYGALNTMLKEKSKFIFMRRTQSQCDMINKPDFSPFKPIMRDNKGLYIGSVSLSKYNAGFYYMQKMDDDTFEPMGSPIGYTCALSTISNMRGFDASDCKVLLYDEFIPEAHERPIRFEGDALLNCYETINRNRDINGGEPLKLLAMTNANDLACPIFQSLGLIDRVDKMARKNKPIYIDSEKGIAIVMLQNSPISDKKRETALYKLTKDSTFAQMALDNKFSKDSYEYVKQLPLKEFKPMCVIGEVCIYEHKSNDTYYVTRHISGTPPVYKDSDLEIARFKNDFGTIWFEVIAGKVSFSDFYSKNYLSSIFS